ncbi:MAG: anaerobic ribonucleoside-triphosphate reductase activating protein [Patescibacteria group bacterium]
MLIAGLQPTTLIDYPDKLAAIVFTHGCQFRCGYCHNPEIVGGQPPQEFSVASVLEFLRSRQGLLEGVVVTGGEPTLHPDLADFLQSVRDLGFAIKLDTNGTNPERLKEIIDRKLVDYLAMDIKAPLAKYNQVTGVKVNPAMITRSIELIKNSGVSYEFRSTIMPFFHTTEDVTAMAQMITGAPRYYLQTFRNSGKLLDPTLASARGFSEIEMTQLARHCREFVGTCEVR